MITFTAYLAEVLSSPVAWHWLVSETDEWLSAFTVGGHHYDVAFLRNDADTWELMFKLDDDEAEDMDKDSIGVTGTGHAFTVFATVMDMLKDFMRKAQPVALTFSALEPSRRRLYDRFIRLLTLPGYHTSASGGVYWIRKN